MLSMYPTCFYKEEDGYSVIFPDLNYLATQGDSLEDAMEMAIECLTAYLHSCKVDGEAVPAPSNLTDINPVDVSKEVEAYAKTHFEKSVRKTLTIPAWLNAAALEQGINFSQTLQEALLSKVRAR